MSDSTPISDVKTLAEALAGAQAGAQAGGAALSGDQRPAGGKADSGIPFQTGNHCDPSADEASPFEKSTL